MKKAPILIISAMICVFFIAASSSTNAALTLTRSTSSTTFTQAGEIVTFTYVVKNTGSEMLDEIILTDDNTRIACPKNALSPGAMMTCTWKYAITAADVNAGKVDPTATVTGYTVPNNQCCTPAEQATASSSALLLLVRPLTPRATLQLIKTADKSSYSQVGEQITYTYSITNNTRITIWDPVTVTDDRLQLTCPPPAARGLLLGAFTCTATYNVSMDDMRSGSIKNTASAQAGEHKSNSATLEILVAARPELTLSKTAFPANYTAAGESILFNLLVSNTGNVPLTGPLIIYDPMLPTWQCSVSPLMEFLPGETVQCNAALAISTNAVGATIKNTASASLNYGSTVINSNDSSATVFFIPAPTPYVDCTTLLWDTCEKYPICYFGSTETCLPRP